MRSMAVLTKTIAILNKEDKINQVTIEKAIRVWDIALELRNKIIDGNN